MEMGNAGVFLIKKVKLARKIRARHVQARWFTPADYFHMHPSICSLDGTETRIFFDSPLCEAWFHCKVQAPAKELRFGVEDSIPQNRHGMGVRRSPLYFACDKTRDGKGNYGANLNEILSQDKCLQAQ